jgi:phosphoketolase
VVIPKADAIPNLFSPEEARRLMSDGGALIPSAGYAAERAELVLVAVGAYQLGEALRASQRLAEREVAHIVVYLLEPGRFRLPRSRVEEEHLAPAQVRSALFPRHIRTAVLLTHTRPEPMLGMLEPFHKYRSIAGLGYINRGGTYDTPGLLFVNRCSWAHCVAAAARLSGVERERLLESSELAALDGQLSPQGVIIPEPG